MSESLILPKLVAVTHNYIGPNLKHSRLNTHFEGEKGVAICISGEHLLTLEKPWPGNEKNWIRLVELVRDKKIAELKPEALLLYIGKTDTRVAMSFAANFRGSIIHLVINDDRVARYDMETALRSQSWPFSPVLHYGETTGNLTMERLIQEFLRTGSIAPEPIWF